MVAVPVGVVTGYGINADRELAEAFRRAGGAPELVHVQDLIDGARKVSAFRILAFPGGFSFGDHLGSGLVFAHMVRRRLRRELDLLLADGGLVLGVCNGFQALVKMGILPNLGGGWQPQVSLVHNASGLFEDSWVEVEFDADSPCVWTQGLAPMELPIRHGEGRFIAASQAIMSEIDRNHLAAVRYRGRNPNGSQGGVAGITDATGRVFGLMPHPEAFLYPENHPRWSRDQPTAARDQPTAARDQPTAARGLELFENGVRAAQ